MIPTVDSPSASSCCDLEPSSDPSMYPFSTDALESIRALSNKRCVLCLRALGNAGQCNHVIDSSDTVGKKMMTLGNQSGILEANYSRSSVENGVLLCGSCHKDFLTTGLLALCPPKEVLEYLIECAKSHRSIPIHEVLDRLRANRVSYAGLPDPQQVLPFMGLYTLIPLDPEELENVDFLLYHQADASKLVNSCWVPAPPGTHSVTRICDARAPTNHCPVSMELSATNERYLWRLPTAASPILTTIMYNTAHLFESDIEEIHLVNKLRSLLYRDGPRDPGGGLSGGSGAGGYGLGGGREKQVERNKGSKVGSSDGEDGEMAYRQWKAAGFLRKNDIHSTRSHVRHFSTGFSPAPVATLERRSLQGVLSVVRGPRSLTPNRPIVRHLPVSFTSRPLGLIKRFIRLVL